MPASIYTPEHSSSTSAIPPGQALVEKAFLDAIAPYPHGIVAGCECMFAWYWLLMNAECGTWNANRSQLITHLQILTSQYNLPPFEKKLTYKGIRTGRHRRTIPNSVPPPTSNSSPTTTPKLIEPYRLLAARRSPRSRARITDARPLTPVQ